MPADQETIRYTGVYGEDRDGRPYLMREVLGGGSGGRYYADGEDTIHVVPDSRNLPSEFTESRFPFLVESLGLAMDSGGAGEHRGGLGYEKHIRMLKDGSLHVHRRPLDPGLLGCARRAGRQAVRGDHRPGRSPRARGRRPRRRRAGAGRRGHPDPYDGWWRLGRPAGPRPGPGGARRGVAQGLAGGRPGRLRRGADGLAGRRTTWASTPTRRPPSARGDRGRTRRSSTAARATRDSPAARAPRRWTTCDADDHRDQGRHGAGRRQRGAHLGDRLASTATSATSPTSSSRSARPSPSPPGPSPGSRTRRSRSSATRSWAS